MDKDLLQRTGPTLHCQTPSRQTMGSQWIALLSKNLLAILSEIDTQDQRAGLQFTTGSPRLPKGGWKAMRSTFTVLRKNCDASLTADDCLPSMMTCANYLKMPDYLNKTIMHEQLLKTMEEGTNGFLLS